MAAFSLATDAQSSISELTGGASEEAELAVSSLSLGYMAIKDSMTNCGVGLD